MKWIIASSIILIAGIFGMSELSLRRRAGIYWPMFVAASQVSGVPSALLAAQAAQESGFDPTARSGAGAEGIMQLMPQYYSGVDPFDPAQSIPAAAVSMAEYHRRFGSWRLALAAYNWGPTALAKSIKDGTEWPSETRQYVRVVLADAALGGLFA